MKKLILGLISIIILLLIGLLIGPSFIDWNKYKGQIISAAKEQAGYDVEIAGDLSLSLLPSPTLKIEGLLVKAPTKVKFENILQMKSAEVQVQIAPLLQKNIAVDKVTLIDPVVTAEMFKDGTGSWMTPKMKAAKTVVKMAGEKGERVAKQAAGNVLDSIALNRVEIKNGAFVFFDHKKNMKHDVQNMNTVLKAQTLKGPYAFDGGFSYNEKDIRANLQVSAFDPNQDSLSINGAVSLVKDKAQVQYDGIVATKAPFDAQGQVKVILDNGMPNVMAQKISLEGLLTASEDKIAVNDLIGFLGSSRASGKFSISNFKQKNPVNVFADLKFNQVIDLSGLKKAANKANNKSTISSSNSTEKNAPSKKVKSFAPSSLTFPMAVDAQITLDAPSVKMNNKTFDGVFLSVVKKASKTTITAKALGLPGQGKVEGRIDASFGSSSVSPKSGAVTYADPSVSFVAEGNIGQIDKALSVFAPNVDKKTAGMFKTAQFDLKGTVSPTSVSLKDSVLKLDQTSIGLGGRYTPSTNGGRDKAVIDLSVGDIDVDRLTGKKGNTPSKSANKTSASSSSASSAKSGGLKEALKPLQEFKIPVDLVFDISVQKARVNGMDISGVRLTGESAGNKLTLKNASVNNYQGATLSAKGVIVDRATLSGLDTTLGFKTKDIQGFAKTMNLDVSKLPSTLKSVDANVSLNGAIDSLTTDAKIKAMGGQLDVAGLVKDALGTPQMSDMRVGLKHPNLSQAIKVVAPDFKGNAGLSQAINFSTKASTVGKVINLSGVKATLGKTSFTGNVKVDQTGSKPSVSGKIQAGIIALDQLLGAKSAKKSSPKSSGSSSSSSSSSKERWSKSTINVDWMNNMNVNLDLSANAINYGAWNFVKPSTTLKIQNGTLDVTGLKAGVFGGQATLNTKVKAPAQSGGALSLSMDSTMNGVSLEALAYALSKSKQLKSSGTVSFNFDVASNGASAYTLVNALNGKATLDGRDVILKGFDLNKMARGLAVEEKLADSVNSLVSGATRGGQTQFDTIKGDYKVEKGIVKINSMVMESDVSQIDSTGYVSLPEWNINTDHKITLKEITDLEPFSVKIKGPLDNPSNTFGKNILEDYLGAKLKRKLAKELPDILGGDVSDTLEGLGILPKAQKKIPTQEPTNDNIPPAQKQEVAPQKTAPKKIEKPEDALKELLNSDNPEDAVGNVLRGLF